MPSTCAVNSTTARFMVALVILKMETAMGSVTPATRAGTSSGPSRGGDHRGQRGQ